MLQLVVSCRGDPYAHNSVDQDQHSSCKPWLTAQVQLDEYRRRLLVARNYDICLPWCQQVLVYDLTTGIASSTETVVFLFDLIPVSNTFPPRKDEKCVIGWFKTRYMRLWRDIFCEKLKNERMGNVVGLFLLPAT